MSTARQTDLIPIADYLEGELTSEVKHEYVAGVVYAMTGGTIAHSIIATNVIRTLGNQLEGSPCREFNSDAKVRVRSQTGTRFYYPDAQVVCDSKPQSDVFQDSPVLVFEVLSDSTRRIDEEEKKESYLSIPSLHAYVMFEQDKPQAVVFQRTETGFERSLYQGLDATIELTEPGVTLSFTDIYRDIRFTNA